MMLPGWFGAFAAIALFAFLLVSWRSKGARTVPLDLETHTVAGNDIAVEKLGPIASHEADGGAAGGGPRLTRLAASLSFNRASGLRGRAAPLTVAASVFCLMVGLGSAATFLATRPMAPGLAHTEAHTVSEPHDETLSRLKDYARAIPSEKAPAVPAAGKTLPDVETMIDRLAARLQVTPGDLEGWRLLGWSYFHTSRYQQATIAFAKALELDPNSADLKQAHADAQAKASQGVATQTPPAMQTGSVDRERDGRGEQTSTKSAAATPSDHTASIRAMVDGLADRLERSPRDVEGWARLMRSRVVLGERDVATAALQKALEIFKDDATASSTIRAAATELGLKSD